MHKGRDLDEPSDDELLAMFLAGDVDAFDALFDRHHVAVHHFARVMLNDAQKAEDVMQEAFLAVARAAKGYRPRGRFRPWLMRIARNQCLNMLQAERARREVLARDGDLLPEPASGGPSVPEQLGASEEVAAVWAALTQLPERQREALALYAFEGMAYKEISEALQAPMGTVKTLIHRARANLARALGDVGGEQDDV